MCVTVDEISLLHRINEVGRFAKLRVSPNIPYLNDQYRQKQFAVPTYTQVANWGTLKHLESRLNSSAYMRANI